MHFKDIKLGDRVIVTVGNGYPRKTYCNTTPDLVEATVFALAHEYGCKIGWIEKPPLVHAYRRLNENIGLSRYSHMPGHEVYIWYIQVFADETACLSPVVFPGGKSLQYPTRSHIIQGTDLSDWRTWAHKAPGECACGIPTERCDYHRKG